MGAKDRDAARPQNQNGGGPEPCRGTNESSPSLFYLCGTHWLFGGFNPHDGDDDNNDKQ